MSTVDELKAKGNAAFAAKDFDAAVAAFSEAIAVSSGDAGAAAPPSQHVLFSNRSAALASLERYDDALADARKCVELAPTWAKGYSRLGLALFKLGKGEEAAEAYEKGLELEPDNEALKAGLADATRALNAKDGDGLFGPSFLAKLAADPSTRGLAGDAEFARMLAEVRRDPSAMSKFLSDERFQRALSVALGVSIVAGAGGGGAGGEGGEGGGAAGEEGASPSAAGEGGQGPATPAPAPAGGDGGGGGSGGGSKAADAPEPPAPPPPAAETETEEERAAKAEAARLKAQAAALKEQGNAHYKSKKFAEAIEAYSKALELDPSDVTLLTNRAAAKLESGDAAGTVEDCDAAVELGRSLRADFKLVAKALARKGAALAKQGDLEAAIACYQKSLTEHRAPDALKRLGEAERELKRRKEEAYVDLVLASAERERGNEAFQQGRFPEAVKHYTEALARGPPGRYEDAHKLLSNRAACFTKLGAWQDGVKDADACIKLKPDFVKGYSRKGHLQFFMKDFDKALETYRAGLAVEPDSAELKEGMARCVAAIRSFSAGGATDAEVAERQQRALADPEIQNILQDPVIRQVLQDFQDDPEAARRHAAQPEVMAKIEKLVAAGIVRMS